MFRRVLLSCVLLVGCKSTVPSADSMSPLTGPAPTTSVELASAPTTSSQAVVSLKTTSKQPFPDGPDDETLCAAIHSKEVDVGARFGHFIPMFWNGVIWVGEGDEEVLEATKRAIATYAPRLLLAEGRACSKGGVLLYVEDLYDGYADSLGNKHTIAELEQAAFKASAVAKGAMRERVLLDGARGMAALEALCERDAVTCDQRLRLRFGEGICADVLGLAADMFRSRDRPWAKTALGRSGQPNFDEPKIRREFLDRCQEVPVDIKVCSIVDYDKRGSRDQCWASLAPLFGY